MRNMLSHSKRSAKWPLFFYTQCEWLWNSHFLVFDASPICFHKSRGNAPTHFTLFFSPNVLPMDNTRRFFREPPWVPNLCANGVPSRPRRFPGTVGGKRQGHWGRGPKVRTPWVPTLCANGVPSRPRRFRRVLSAPKSLALPRDGRWGGWPQVVAGGRRPLCAVGQRPGLGPRWHEFSQTPSAWSELDQQRSFLLAQFFLKKSIFEKTEPAGFSRLFG